MELTSSEKTDLINLVNVGNISEIKNFLNNNFSNQQCEITQLESVLNSYEKYKLIKKISKITRFGDLDDLLNDNTNNNTKTKLLLYYRPEVILFTDKDKNNNIIDELIRNNKADVLKLLFKKVIENNYDISTFNFWSYRRNKLILIDIFALEEGSFETFKEVMIYIKTKCPLYHAKFIIDTMLNPKNKIIIDSWYRTLANKEPVIQFVRDLFNL